MPLVWFHFEVCVEKVYTVLFCENKKNYFPHTVPRHFAPKPLRTTPLRPIQFRPKTTSPQESLRPKTTSPQVTSSQNHFAPNSADVFFCKPNPKPNP